MQMRAAVAALVLATILAGCSDGGGSDVPETYTCPDGTVLDLADLDANQTADPASACPQKTVYDLTVKVTRETPTGPVLPSAEIYIVPVALFDASDPDSLGVGRYADNNGLLRTVFEEPTEVLIQVFGPDATKWTREGLRLMVGETVTTPDDYTVEGRTVIVPLFQSKVKFNVTGTWGPAVASPGTGSLTPAVLTPVQAILDVPAEVAPLYWSRLTNISVTLEWENDPTAPSYGDLYAGLAYGGELFATGSDDPNTSTGVQQEVVEARAPQDRADPTQPVEVTALTQRALVGQSVDLRWHGTLSFKGKPPAGMPVPGCLASQVECSSPQLPELGYRLPRVE